MQYANYVQPTVEIGGETYEVKLEIVDNRTSAENGPSAAAELMNRDVSIVLGSYGSGVSMAGGEVFAEAGVPAIGIGCTNPQVTADCPVYFRICFLDPFQGTVLANYAYKELGVTTAYTLAMLGSDYDQGVVYYFKQAFEALGGTVVSEDFPEGTSNFVSYINNAQSAGAGVIMAPVSTNYAQLIIEAASSQGFEGELLGSDTWDNNMVVESAKGKDVSIKVTTFYQEGGAPEFDSGIKERINANPNALTNNGGNDMSQLSPPWVTTLTSQHSKPSRPPAPPTLRLFWPRCRPSAMTAYPATLLLMKSATPSATPPTSRPPTPKPALGNSTPCRVLNNPPHPV